MAYEFSTNSYSDSYIPEINENAFNKFGAETTYRKRLGDTLFKPRFFYIIIGCDSGLLPQHILEQGIAEDTEYLFIEDRALLPTIQPLFPEHPQFHLCNESNWEESANNLNLALYMKADSTIIVRSLGVAEGKYPPYIPLYKNCHNRYQSIYLSTQATLSKIHFYELGLNNLAENQHMISVLANQFIGKTAIILGAGPSLDDQLPWIQANQDRLYIFAVSRLAKKLHRLNITPDFIVTVDALESTYYEGRESFLFEDKALLIHAYHANARLVAQWNGKHAFTGPRFPWQTEMNTGYQNQTGITVTNTCLDSAINLGFTNILLAGVDFCLGKGHELHTSDSGSDASQAPVLSGEAIHEAVTTNAGEQAQSTWDFIQGSKQFSDTVLNYKQPHQHIINLSPYSMRMEGVEHALNEAIHPEEKSISPLDNIPEQPLSNYYNSCLHELKRSKKQLQEIIRLSTEAIQENKKMKRGGDISRIDKQLKEIEKKFTQKYSHHYQVIKQLSTSESLKNLKATGKDPSTWTMADIADSSIAYHQTIKQLTQKMVEMVNGAVDKIGLRKEELNPHPKQPLKFFNLWREEEQERRAIFWQQNNADHISQLNENERTTLDQLLEQFHSDYERDIDDVTDENNIHTALERIIELSTLNDRLGLEEFAEKLASHPDEAHRDIYRNV
jgi:uncharacterized Rossmann fold enzyme